MAGEDFPMAGEDFGQPASPQPIEIHWIFLIFLILAVGRPEAWRYGIRWFSMKFRRKNVVIMKRHQECEQNPLKLIHSSAKHYFEVHCTHLGACCAVWTRF